MTNPLTTLDELIWRQFEKVTIAAEKRLGWDKWDLAKISCFIAAGANTGIGVYQVIKGLVFSQYEFVPGGTLVGLGGIASYVIADKVLNELKVAEERRFARGETIIKSHLWEERPVLIALGSFSVAAGVYSLIKGSPYIPERYQSDPSAYNTVTGLSEILGGSWIASLATIDYFLSQLPRPPSSAKKSLWQALADYVSKPFHKEQQPAEVPVVKYNVEERAVVAGPPIPGA